MKIVKPRGGKVLDQSEPRLLILEFVDEHEKNEETLKKLSNFDILETVRSGNIAIQKGKKTLTP
jgi:acetolactate synthase small subunit